MTVRQYLRITTVTFLLSNCISHHVFDCRYMTSWNKKRFCFFTFVVSFILSIYLFRFIFHFTQVNGTKA